MLAKAEEQRKKGATVVCMLRAGAPETRWWENSVLEHWEERPDGSELFYPKHEIRYLKPRVRFQLPEWPGFQDRPDFPSCLVIMRPQLRLSTSVWWWKWK